ncbi:hypothetical protein LCM17_18495 [Cereibacter sphaeroides]|nr:hypothetical protein [Cereibacter sphaeroides]
MQTIIDSGNIQEIEGLGIDESDDLSDLTATTEKDPQTMDFHVQMRGYTMRDFETMVVHAAAQQLLGGRNFQRQIEEAAIAIASQKVDQQIGVALRDVMGMTVTTRGKEAITLGQMIGMEAKDYLTQQVDGQGKVVTDSWGRSSSKPRVSFLVGQFVREHFAKEIEAAMKVLRDEIAAGVSAQITAAVESERKKIADAIGFEIKRIR